MAAPTERIEARGLERMTTQIQVPLRPEFPWYARGVRILVLAAVLGACGADKPSGPTATGSLVFDPQPASTVDAFLAGEGEVIRSALLRRRLEEYERVTLDADAIAVNRRPGTLIIDVTVADKDPQRAAHLCNGLLRTYLDYGRMRALSAIQLEQQAVASELERRPNDDHVAVRMQQLDIVRTTARTDVRVLDGCTVATASRR